MAAIIVVILGVLMVVFTIKHLFYGGSRFNHSTSVEQQNKAKSQKKKNKPVKNTMVVTLQVRLIRRNQVWLVIRQRS